MDEVEKFEQEIERIVDKLPTTARVALAVRCAKRVIPVFKSWDTEKKFVRDVDSAINTAEAHTFGSTVSLSSATAFAASVKAAGVASVQVSAANAAAYAVSGAIDAAICSIGFQHGATATFTVSVVNAAASIDAANARYILRDAEQLLRLAKEGGWSDRTPVPVTAFGPMWPDGPPAWARFKGVPKALELELVCPEGMSDDEFVSRLSDLVGEMDDYHRSIGGEGLDIDTLEIESEVMAEVTS